MLKITKCFKCLELLTIHVKLLLKNFKEIITMALPKGLTLVNDSLGKPFITLRDRSITFSKQAIEELKYAEYVHMFINKEDKIVVFQKCEQDDAAIPFYKEPKEGQQLLVRLTGKKNPARIMDIAGIKSCNNGIRIYGEYLEEDIAIVFDLHNIK